MFTPWVGMGWMVGGLTVFTSTVNVLEAVNAGLLLSETFTVNELATGRLVRRRGPGHDAGGGSMVAPDGAVGRL